MLEPLIILLLFCFLIKITYSRLRFSYINPCILAQCYWLLLGVFPYLFVGLTTQLQLPFEGLIFIWICLVSMVAGSYLMPARTLRGQCIDTSLTSSTAYTNKLSFAPKASSLIHRANPKKLSILIIIFTVISLASSALLVLLNGIDIYSSIFLVGAQFAEMRNESSLVSFAFLTGLQNLSIYLSALLIGRYIIPSFLIDSRFNIFILLTTPPFFAVVVIALMQGQKGIVALFFFLLIGGFILFLLESSVSYSDLSSLSRTKNFRILLVVTLAPIILGLVLPFLSRGLLSPTGELTSAASSFGEDNPLLIYSLGHMPNFLEWFNDVVLAGHQDPSYSIPFIYSFRDLVLLVFGSKDPLPSGVYDDYRLGNIYTAFRGLINDFGLAGSVVVSAILGALSHLSFALCQSSRKYWRMSGQIGCILFFQLLFQSYGVSAFIWKSTYILPFAYVLADQFLVRKKPCYPIS